MDHVTQLHLISVLILIICSAIFSCFETAITATSKAKVHRLKNEGSKKAAALEELLKNREKVISAMLLGNNTVNILASAIATSMMIKLFGESGLLYATVVMTLMVLIFAEVMPKNYAMKSPETIALAFAPAIVILVKIFSPLIILVHKIVDFVVDNLNSTSSKKHKVGEYEEIRDTVNLKHQEGSIYKYDKDMIDGVLDLSDTEISEIMVHRKDIESINIDLPVKEIIKQALSINYTRIPLWKGNKENIVAILNVRKLLKALHFYKTESLDKFDLKTITTEAWFVPSTNSLRAQLFAFRKKRRRFALVIDEYGSLLGLITLEDILEEIVGEIKDKEEELEIKIIRIKSGAYKIVGNVLIRDINKRLDWDLAEEDGAYNLTAFIIGRLGRIPDEKDHFIIDEYYFEILKKRHNDLLLVKVKKLQKRS